MRRLLGLMLCLMSHVHAAFPHVEQAVLVLEVKSAQLEIQQAALTWGEAQTSWEGWQGWYVESLPSGLGGIEVELAGGKFLRLGQGRLPLDSTLWLRVGVKERSVGPLYLRAGKGEAELEIVDDRGAVWLLTRGFHHYLRSGSTRLDLDAMTLYAGAELLRLAGMDREDQWYLGRMVVAASLSSAVPRSKGSQLCAYPRWHDGVNYFTDVALEDIRDVNQVELGNPWVTVAPSAMLRNVGTADVPWFKKFSTPSTGSYPPPYNRDQHPLLTWNMYRVDGLGVLRQIGRAEVKHAFNTINYDCSCKSGEGNPYSADDPYIPWDPANPSGSYASILWSASHPDNTAGVGCRDIYWSSTNDDPLHLGLREEVPAYTVAWEQCGSLFAPAAQPGDTPCDKLPASQTYAPAGERRMIIDSAELGDPASRYLVEAWYLVRDDINIFNTMGHVDVVPALEGSIWQFPESNFTQGSILDAWVDPASPGMAASTHTYDNGQGHAGMAVRVLEMGGGIYRYVMALANHDFDPAISSVSLILEPGFTVLGGGFHDADTDPANDWSFSRNGDVLNWQAPADGSNPQRWGNLYVYWYEVAGAAPLPWRPQGVAQASPASATDTPFSFDVLVPAQRIFDGGFE